MKKIKNHVLYISILVFLVISSYVNSLNNVFISDDISSLITNKNIYDLGYILTHPLRLASDIQSYTLLTLFGQNPVPFRIVNILFHFFNVVLLYILVYQYKKREIAFVAASLFAVHPILTESVTWISGAPYVQYATFFLISLILYTKRSSYRWAYIGSVVAFSVCLLLNGKAVALPLVFVLYEMSQKSKFTKMLHRSSPYFVISIIWLIFQFVSIEERLISVRATIQADYNNPLVLIPYAIYSYLLLLFYPKDLTFYHADLKFPVFNYIIALILTVIYISLVVYFFKKNKFVFFWLVFFIIPLLPTLTPLPLAMMVAERYVYLSTISFAILISLIAEKFIDRKITNTIAYILVATIVIVFSFRVISRNADWQDQDTFWTATIITSPYSSQAHNNIADVYVRHGDDERAKFHLETAIRLRSNYADAHHNLALIYTRKKDWKNAVTHYQSAIKYNPNLWQSHQNLGVIYHYLGRDEDAEKELRIALRLGPQNSVLEDMLGEIRSKQN